jgi:hypothetical protein
MDQKPIKMSSPDVKVSGSVRVTVRPMCAADACCIKVMKKSGGLLGKMASRGQAWMLLAGDALYTVDQELDQGEYGGQKSESLKDITAIECDKGGDGVFRIHVTSRCVCVCV